MQLYISLRLTCYLKDSPKANGCLSKGVCSDTGGEGLTYGGCEGGTL